MGEHETDILLEELQRIRVTLEGVRVSLSTLTEIGADHECRLRAVEKRQQAWAPVVGAAVFVAGAVVTLLVQNQLTGRPSGGDGGGSELNVEATR